MDSVGWRRRGRSAGRSIRGAGWSVERFPNSWMPEGRTRSSQKRPGTRASSLIRHARPETSTVLPAGVQPVGTSVSGWPTGSASRYVRDPPDARRASAPVPGLDGSPPPARLDQRRLRSCLHAQHGMTSRTRRMTSETRTFASYDTHHLVDRVQTAWVRGSHERLQDAHSPCEAPGHSTLRVEMGLGARCVWECGSWETTCGFPLPAFVPPSRGQASWE